MAGYAVRSVCDAVIRTTRDAQKAYPNLPVVFSGGVASNAMLRKRCAEFDAVFASPEFSELTKGLGIFRNDLTGKRF